MAGFFVEEDILSSQAPDPPWVNFCTTCGEDLRGFPGSQQLLHGTLCEGRGSHCSRCGTNLRTGPPHRCGTPVTLHRESS